MSVVVRGMEMPKDCIVCYETTKCFGTGRCFEDGTIWCGLAKGYIGLKDTSEKCPLVELPEKHGPLIDRNELEKAVLKWLPPDPCGREEKEYPFETDICVSMMMEIEEQETIVEAEGEE